MGKEWDGTSVYVSQGRWVNTFGNIVNICELFRVEKGKSAAFKLLSLLKNAAQMLELITKIIFSFNLALSLDRVTWLCFLENNKHSLWLISLAISVK